MRSQIWFKVLLSFSAFTALVCLWPVQEPCSAPSSAEATIQATATVIEPLGMVQQPNSDLHHQFLLYAPRLGHAQCQITYPGQPTVSLVLSDRDPASYFDFPSVNSSRAASGDCLVTITYTEN
jgi:hypothetical protein